MPTQFSTHSSTEIPANPASVSRPKKQPGAVSRLRARVNRRQVSKATAVAIMVLMSAIGAVGVYFSRPKPVTAQVNMGMQSDTPDIVWLRGKIRETGGDYLRLNADERARADKISKPLVGMSADALFANPSALKPVDPNAFQQARTDAYLASQKR